MGWDLTPLVEPVETIRSVGWEPILRGISTRSMCGGQVPAHVARQQAAKGRAWKPGAVGLGPVLRPASA